MFAEAPARLRNASIFATSFAEASIFAESYDVTSARGRKTRGYNKIGFKTGRAAQG
jgi:hypothetical protein